MQLSQHMTYIPPKPGQEIQPFELREVSEASKFGAERSEFDAIRGIDDVGNFAPYTSHSDEWESEELVSETGRHRFTTNIEDDLITRGSTMHAANKATIMSSVLNLTNTILGAGLLGLSYAVSRSGYILGVMLFLIFSFFSSIGLHLLMASARLVPQASFYTLSQKTIPKVKRLVDLAVAIKCFGVGTSYFIVIGGLSVLLSCIHTVYVAFFFFSECFFLIAMLVVALSMLLVVFACFPNICLFVSLCLFFCAVWLALSVSKPFIFIVKFVDLFF